MRQALINFLTKEAAINKDLVLITGDLGFGVFEDFSKKFPDQFINAGIAEQNMTSMACGLALEGCKVFTYSIGNFSTLRCLEQIRNDICYHNADVTVVTVGAGFSYGQLGISHFATEDIAILRSIPNISILSPCDPWETESLLDQTKLLGGPKYLRLDKSNANTKKANILFGIPRKCSNGKDAIIFSTGGLVGVALKVAERLKKININISVYSVHTIKPLDLNFILNTIDHIEAVFTLEEHTILGGLGSSIAEIIAESGYSLKIFKRFGLKDEFPEIVGDQKYLRKNFRLDEDSIYKEISTLI